MWFLLFPNVSIHTYNNRISIFFPETDYEEPGTPKPSRYQKCINVAIAGQNAEAKAALVNLIREIDPEHEDAAKSDSKDLVPYRLNKIENLLLWLIPFGEKGDEEALKKVEFDSYDAVVVCCTGNLGESAIWLTTEARKGHAKIFIVKTDTDKDVDADKSEKGDSHDEKALLQKLQSDIASQLEGSDDIDVYLVSTKRQFENQWDMPTLVSKISDLKKAEKKSTDKDQPVAETKQGDDSPETGKIEKMATSFMSQVKEVVTRAAKKGSLGVLHKEIAKYKKSFGVEKLELPSVNLESLEDAVHQLMPDKKKLKDTFMACFGSRSKGAQTREAKQKIRDTIEDEGPTLLENAINACKTAALEQVSKEAL